MTLGDQVNKLNVMVKLRLGPSPIHGVGVFALRDIAEGTKLYADHMPEVYTVPHSSFGKLFPEVAALLLERYPRIVTGSRFIYPDTRHLAYMNHSDKPNYDANHDIALQDIKAGEEITEDYRMIDGYDQVFTWLDADT